MNKKFSTLVAALLVTGGSFAMVSQYAGSALAESPLAVAAAANLRATQIPGYDLKAQAFDANATVWTLSGTELSTTINGEKWYVTASAALSKTAGEAAAFSFTANQHIRTGGNYLVVSGEALAVKSTLTDGDKYATFFKTANNDQEAAGQSSYVSYIGAEDIVYAQGSKGVYVTEGTFNYAKAAVTITAGNFSAVKKTVKIVKSSSNAAHHFLTMVTENGTVNYLHVSEAGVFSVSPNEPMNEDYMSSLVTMDGTNKVLQIGGKHLKYDASNVFALNSGYEEDKDYSLYDGESGAVESTLPDTDRTYILVNLDDSERSNMTSYAAGCNYVSFSMSNQAAAVDAAGDLTLKVEGSNFTLANGTTYLNGNAAKETAGQFSLDENGAIKTAAGQYLVFVAGTGLTTATELSETYQGLYLYADGTTTPMTTPVDGTVKVATATITHNGLTASTSKVANAVAQATVDVPADITLGNPAALTTDAYYWLLDKDGTETMVPNYSTALETWSLVDLAKANIDDNDIEGLWKVTAVKWNKDGAATHYSFTYRSNDQIPLAFSIKFNKDTKEFGAPVFDPDGKYTAFYVDAHKVGDNTYNYLTFVSDEKVEYRGNTYTDQKTYGLQQKNGEWTMVELSDACEEMKITKTSDIDITGTDNAAKWVDWLNNKAGNGQGFGLAYILNDKKQTLEDNVLTEGVTAVQGPDLTWLKDVAGVDLSEKMFLKISGDYEYVPYSSLRATTEQKQALAASQLAAFRSSKFVAVDTVLYSSIIDDAKKYYYLVSVSGSEMLSSKGQVATGKTYDQLYKKTADGYVGSLLTRRIENAEFEVHHAKGSTIEDPVYVKVPEVRIPVSYNEKGIIDVNETATDGHYSAGAKFVAIKNYNKKLYVGAAGEAEKAEFIITKNNDVDFTKVNGIVNIISRNYKTDGQVLANVEGDDPLNWVLPQYVALDKPEGQFLVTGGDYNKYGEIQPFTFTNRESGEDWVNVSLKATDKENIYAVVGMNDTIEVKAANAGDEFIGYANYSADKLKNSKFVLKVVSKVGGVDDLYITEDHNKDHSLGLDADTTASATFRLIKFEDKKSTAKAYGDTVYVNTNEYSYINSKKEYAEKADRVVAFTYAIYNADNMEFLAWNEQGSTKEQYFYSNPNMKYNEQTGANAAAAQRFIIKEKNDGTVQLIPVEHINEAGKNIFEVATVVGNPVEFNDEDVVDSKVYVGLSDNKLHVEETIYKIADNDLFRVVEVGAPMYRKLDGEVYDKVRIYKEGMQNVALFAQGTDATILSGKNFLGMEHKADADLNKTMFSFMVDTAFVDRADNYKPQYLLAIDAEVVPEATYCPEHGLNPDCSHTTKKIGYAKGSYLVCLSDSAAAWSASKAHNNPYMYDGYARLGFVKAAHIGDALAIERGKAVAADTLDLTGMTEASFALRIVDQDSKSFVMETKDGWIKWLNGVPVVVPTLAQAEVLNIEATENAATANEAIAAEGVQVIGGKGAVTVQGAAGKVITVANILGQTIANQVAASDNVTIAAPAGVVVVAVEGDATKVVVK